MKVLRAAVVLGLSTPLVVLACGSDDKTLAQQEGEAGQGGEADSRAGAPGTGGSSAGTAGTGTAGTGTAGTPAGGGAAGEGGTAPIGEGGAGGAGDVTAGAAGAGGASEPEPECGDASVAGTLVCFAAPVPLTVVEGTPTDLAIGAWDAAEGLDVIVASSSGLAYFSNAAGGFTTDTYLGTAGHILGAGRLDSDGDLDLLLGQDSSGNTIVDFGAGTGAIATTETSFFNSEGVLFNYFVANVAGSSASQDVVVTFENSISVVQTTGTEGEGFLGPISATYPPSPQDGVLAKLGSAQSLVYSTGSSISRQLLTYDAGSIALGAAQATPAGGPSAQLDVGDFNEDGFDDVAATLTDSAEVNVLFGDGVGTGDFAIVDGTTRYVTLSVGETVAADTTRDVKVGDFNGDGHADLAVSVEGLNAVAIFSGDGEGVFSDPELVSTGDASGPTRLAVGDLNGDGVDDLAVVGATSHKVIILLSDP
jgi:hypothetical protein